MTETTGLDTATAVRRFKALGDATRLGILMELAGGERCVCDLTTALDAGQSLLSFHLRALKDAGLVTDRRAGRWVHYSISGGGLVELEDCLRSMREATQLVPNTSSACCED